MCDIKEYEKIYNKIEELDSEDILQLMMEAETQDKREFYQVVGDFLLQKRQREVIKRKVFYIPKIQ